MHTHSHPLDQGALSARPEDPHASPSIASSPTASPATRHPVWVAWWHRGLSALSGVSPWLMALSLCGAYATTDQPEWVGLNLVFCIGMVVVALLRLWHVLSEPGPGNR